MYKASIIGHFGKNKEYYDGQTIKTKIVAEQLQIEFGNKNIKIVDTHGKIKTLIKLIFFLPRILRKSKNLIILPAHNGLKFFSYYIPLINRFYKRKIHYCVIGGWLPKVCEENKYIKNNLKKFDYIYVETLTMKKNLEKIGFSNIIIMPNCKKLPQLSFLDINSSTNFPIKLCTFSRVMKEKGIEDAINVVNQINRERKYDVFELDIYGQVDENQIQWFDNLKMNFNKSIRYCGIVPFNESTNILKNYFALLFPTKFYTEGIPGTIIDAYSAGLPIIASKWINYDDVIDENKTGISYEFGNYSDLYNKMLYLIDNPYIFLEMKKNCLKKMEDFLPQNVIKKMKIE